MGFRLKNIQKAPIYKVSIEVSVAPQDNQLIRFGARQITMVSRWWSATPIDREAKDSKSLRTEPRDSVVIGTPSDESRTTSLNPLRALTKANQADAKDMSSQREQLKSAMSALPRDKAGQVAPEILVDSDRTLALSEAVERLVLEGLGSGAEFAFERAVQLFVEYADDLALDDVELEKARDQMLADVRDIVSDNEIRPWEPGKPAPAMMNLEKAVEMLQDKVMERRHLMLEASGDLSRVLSELTVLAKNGDEEDVARLGDFLDRFSGAVRARSASHIRQKARNRLLQGNPFEVSAPEDSYLGDAFLTQLESVVGE